MRLFLIACEPSGDTHGASLLCELKKLHPGLEARGLGGPKMAEAGLKLLHDMTRLSALGLGDVLRQYFTYRKIFYEALEDVNRWKPDAVVVIDSPAFNLRFAKKIKNRFPVIYYISPQLWAWGGRRIKLIQKYVSKMLVILPFEKELYDKAGVDSEFVGHPLLDHISIPTAVGAYRNTPIQKERNGYSIGLLPGSRESEVRRIFPLMLETAVHLKNLLPDVHFFVKPSPNVPAELYQDILTKKGTAPKTKWGQSPFSSSLEISESKLPLYDFLSSLDFALITSGTATLEAALTGTPYFLFYKTAWSTYFLGKHLIRVPYLGIVNLLAGKSVVPEFIQNDIHPSRIAYQAKVLLENRELYERMKQEFEEVRKKLGEPGASSRAAEAISAFLMDPSPSPASFHPAGKKL